VVRRVRRGWPQMILLFFIMRCTPIIRELIVATRYRCPLHRLPASRLLLPRSGWSAATLCHGTFETCRGGLTMSVDWDRAEVTFQGRGDRFYPARKSAFTQPLKVAPWPPAPQPSECQRKITFVLGFQSRCANVWPVGSTSPRRNSTRGSHDQSGPAHCWLPLVAAR
jgi:hypothetical protein